MKFGRSWIDEALRAPEAWVRRWRDGDGRGEREAWTRWREQAWERRVAVARTATGPIELGHGLLWVYPLRTGLQRMRELHFRVVAPGRAVSLAAVQDQSGAGARALHQRAVAAALASLRAGSDTERAELCRAVFGYARSVGSSDGIESVLLSCIVAAGQLDAPLARYGLETWRVVGAPRVLGAGLGQTPVLDPSASLVSFIGPDEVAAFGRGVDRVTGGSGLPGRRPGGDPAADSDKDGTCMTIFTIAGGILGAVGGGILGYSAPGSSASSTAQGLGAAGGATGGMLGGASAARRSARPCAATRRVRRAERRPAPAARARAAATSPATTTASTRAGPRRPGRASIRVRRSRRAGRRASPTATPRPPRWRRCPRAVRARAPVRAAAAAAAPVTEDQATPAAAVRVTVAVPETAVAPVTVVQATAAASRRAVAAVLPRPPPTTTPAAATARAAAPCSRPPRRAAPASRRWSRSSPAATAS